MRRIWLAEISVFALSAVSVLSVGCTPAGSAGSGQGSELVMSKCTVCHTIDRIAQAKKDRPAWDQTVARMRAKGAVMTDAEAAQIVEYLSQSGAAK